MGLGCEKGGKYLLSNVRWSAIAIVGDQEQDLLILSHKFNRNILS
jgi:hypothetical protein